MFTAFSILSAVSAVLSAAAVTNQNKNNSEMKLLRVLLRTEVSSSLRKKTEHCKHFLSALSSAPTHPSTDPRASFSFRWRRIAAFFWTPHPRVHTPPPCCCWRCCCSPYFRMPRISSSRNKWSNVLRGVCGSGVSGGGLPTPPQGTGIVQGSARVRSLAAKTLLDHIGCTAQRAAGKHSLCHSSSSEFLFFP